MTGNQLLLALHTAKQEKDVSEKRYKEAQQEVINYLDGASLDTQRIEHGGMAITGTKVESTTLNIDESALHEEIGDTKWHTISRRVLDRKLLEDAVMRDRIDPTILARHSIEVPRKPYVRLTAKEQA